MPAQRRDARASAPIGALRREARPPRRGSPGQASVELLAVVPALLAAGLVAWQLALAGHALWASANAARVAARADAVGRDPRSAALGALPERLRRGARVERDGGALRVRVTLRLPLPGGERRLRVGSAARLVGGGGGGAP